VVPVRRLESGHVLVDVDLGITGTGTFVLDTGATRTAITPLTAARLGIPSDRGRTVPLSTMGGSVEARLVKGSFTVAGVEVERKQVTVVDLASVSEGLGETIAGILGRDFFESVDVALDLSANEVVLYERGSFAAIAPAEDFTPAPFRLWHGLVLVPVALGDADSHAIVDSGSNASIVSRWAVLRAHGVESPEAAYLQGVDGRPVPVRLATFDRVSIGGAPIVGVQFAVCENRACPVGLGDVERLLLGIDAFEHRTTVWSYADKTMYLSLPGRPAPR
jgi:predicted aspartyl protease